MRYLICLTAQECLEYGFATEIADAEDPEEDPQQSAFGSIRDAVLNRGHDRLSSVEQKLDQILNAMQQEEVNLEPELIPAEPDPEEAESEPEEIPEEEPEQKTGNKFGNIFSLFMKEE